MRLKDVKDRAENARLTESKELKRELANDLALELIEYLADLYSGMEGDKLKIVRDLLHEL